MRQASLPLHRHLRHTLPHAQKGTSFQHLCLNKDLSGKRPKSEKNISSWYAEKTKQGKTATTKQG